MSKERHSTAKKLRKYYLQCLKQLLEEDRIALESNTLPSSTEDKLSRMAEALRTFSPDKESSGELQTCVVVDVAMTDMSRISSIYMQSNFNKYHEVSACR